MLNFWFIDLWSEFTPNNVPNRALYNLNDPSGVHISEAGASGISDIILDYVKSPVEGQYTNQNTNLFLCSMIHTPMLAFGYLCFIYSIFGHQTSQISS
jgi:hypothetical protein